VPDLPAASRAARIFRAGDDDAWRRWRDRKLAHAPRSAADLVVEIANPLAPTEAEIAARADRCRRANLAIYATASAAEDKAIPRSIAERLGLVSLDRNYLSDDDGITSIQVERHKSGAGYIPYSDRPLRWHTDGYYNEPSRRIRAFALHCVRSAAAGGENGLVDPEMAYLWLREKNPAWAEALFDREAMAIPAREDEDGIARPESVGPVFFLDEATGDLNMRYTARTRSIAWKDDATVREAAAWLLAQLDGAREGVYRLRLEPGMGLVCNNALHDRTAFREGLDETRLLYRARYHDRIAASARSWDD
jgi:alpha-ketoglutarate-dependent taurine dioxygenase